MSEATVSTAQTQSYISVTEVMGGAPGAEGNTLTSNAFNTGVHQFSPSSTPPVTKCASLQVTLGGSGAGQTATIDLTAIDATQDVVDGTGLKVQAFRIINPSTNTGILTVAPGAASPYPLMGTGNEFEVEVDSEVYKRCNETLPEISGTSGSAVKEIDLTGTGGDVFDIEFLMG